MTDYTDTDLAALIRATTVGYRGLADDTVRLTVDIEPGDADRALELFRRRGTTLILAAIRDDAAQAEQQDRDAEQVEAETSPEKPARHRESQHKGPYSQHARELHRSGFWNARPVLAAIDWARRFVPVEAAQAGHRDVLKLWLGFESWADVPPENLRAWCEENEISHTLPRCYRGGYDNPGDWPPVREVA